MKPPENFDIHDRELRIKSAVNKLSCSKICKANKDLILKYVKHRRIADNLGPDRQYKYMIYLRTMAEYLNKPFDKASKEDIECLVESIYNKEAYWGKGKREKLSTWAKYDYVVVLKVFFRWLKDCENPEETAWLKPPKAEIKRLRPDEILTWDDVVKLSKAAMNPRDRAIPQVLWDCGARIEELLSLKLRDVEVVMGGQAVKLHFRKSKTEIRSPLIVRSAPALLSWIENHPLRNDKNAYLWIKINSHTPMDYDVVRKVLRDLRKRVGMDKPVNCHNFRKSSASYFSHILTPAELKIRYGWRQSSKMLDIYCFPDEEKINGKLLEIEGLKRPETKTREEILPRKCMWCNTVNVAGRDYCSTCKRPLDPEKNLLSARITAKLDIDVKEILEQHPEIVEALARGLIEKGKEGL